MYRRLVNEALRAGDEIGIGWSNSKYAYRGEFTVVTDFKSFCENVPSVVEANDIAWAMSDIKRPEDVTPEEWEQAFSSEGWIRDIIEERASKMAYCSICDFLDKECPEAEIWDSEEL